MDCLVLRGLVLPRPFGPIVQNNIATGLGPCFPQSDLLTILPLPDSYIQLHGNLGIHVGRISHGSDTVGSAAEI